MRTHNAQNDRTKRRYLQYLKEARRYSEDTVDSNAAALARFEAYNKHRDFRSFHIEQAIGFKRHLRAQVSVRTGDSLSEATLYSTLKALRSFFQWLAGQPGFRSRLSYADAQYFNLTDKEVRIATTRREPVFPSTEQIRKAITTMPAATDVQLRDRALVAFTLLTGARDSATISFQLKHLDLDRPSQTSCAARLPKASEENDFWGLLEVQQTFGNQRAGICAVAALSRLKPGFDSPWERQVIQRLN